MKKNLMRKDRSGKIPALIFTALILSLLLIPAADAEIFSDAAIKGTFEDNVVGLLSDKRGGSAGMTMSGAAAGGALMPTMPMGTPYTGSSSSKNSDTSIDLSADLGVSKAIAPDLSLFFAGSAEHQSYSKFTQFDSTIGGLSIGLNTGFGAMVSARIAVNGLVKRFGDSPRDSSAYGASFIVKEKLGPSFWLKEGYAYEKDNARSALFSYNGNAANVWAGYAVLPDTTFLLGYNYLVRTYDEPSGFKVTASTVSVGLEYLFMKKWSVDALYDHQASDSNQAGTNTTDNLFSIGFRCSY